MLENMRLLRKKRGMTMKELGELVGVAEITISTYETGKREPPLDTLCQIADVLDVSLDMLVRGKEKDRPAGRSREEMLKMYDQMSEEELVLLQHLIGTALADKRLQAYLRQANQESR